MDPDRLIAELARRQFGLLGRSQALELGLSRAAIGHRVASGRLERVHRGVYRMPGAPTSWEQRLMAAQLWGAPSAVVSHRAAAQLFRLDGIPSGFVELVTDRACTRPPTGIVLHRTKQLRRSDFGLRPPLLVTGIVRTIIDLGAVLEPQYVEAAFESALRRDPTILPRLVGRLEGAEPRGAGGARVIREILAARDPAARPSEGVFETMFERRLRKEGLPLPVRQFEVKVGRSVARIDFAYPDERLAIETDGHWCHSGRAQWERGLARNNALIGLGWRPLHVTWDDLTLRPDATMVAIRQALAGGDPGP